MFKRGPLSILFTVLAATAAVPGHAQTISVTRDGQDLSLSGKPKWSYISVSPGAKAYFARVEVVVPDGKEVKSVSGPSAMFKEKWNKPGKVMLVLGNMNTALEVEYKDGSKETWNAEIRLKKAFIALKGCVEAGLKVEQAPGGPPVFFAAECSTKEDRVIFNPSVPGDLEWDVTTIFETDGKGERWKIFEISRNNLVAGNDTVANLGFQWNGERTSFTLLQDRGRIGKAAVTDEKKKSRFRVEFGGAQIQTKTPAVTASNFGPYAGAEFISKEVFWKLRSLITGRYVFPLTGGSSYEFTGGLGKVFGKFQPGTSSFGIFGEYDALGQSQEAEEKSVTLQHNQFGFSLLYANTMKDSEFKVLFRYSGLGGDSTNIGANLAYEGMFGKVQKWGAVVGYGSQSAKARAGTSTFGQMSFGATLTF